MTARPIVYALFAVMWGNFAVTMHGSTGATVTVAAACGYWSWMALRALEPARQRRKR